MYDSTLNARARTGATDIDEGPGAPDSGQHRLPVRTRRYVLPPLAATIERRLLVSYRLDAEVAASLLPEGLRPQLVDGSAVAGICLLRLGAFRPAFIRTQIGWGAENAAHRIAVEWDEPVEGSAVTGRSDGSSDATGDTASEPSARTRTRSGVYIPVRHSASRVPQLAGGRLFPGVHRHARFDVHETPSRLAVGFTAPDARVALDVDVIPDADWSSSLFSSVDEASAFYRRGSVGWSPSRGPASAPRYDGLELKTDAWKVAAGRIRSIRSSFFDALPAGRAEVDSVLVMRDVQMRWAIV
ncbi:hypothetical protein [Herbiconiux solani]|uniref:hypothetical protein n=1 Tax=Herbiconiux solani TaxID=661329 RepID=UPI00082665FD|nr:hypothetical protein [Herbiconiux solani]